MNKYISNIVLAIIIAIIPLLGFPPAWRSFFIILLALIVALISYFIYREELGRHPRKQPPSHGNTFIENTEDTTEKI